MTEQDYGLRIADFIMMIRNPQSAIAVQHALIFSQR